MKFILKGICNSSTILQTQNSQLSQLGFDLRPRSFNFTQGENIKVMLGQTSIDQDISLLFEDEKDFVVREVSENIRNSLKENQKLFLEFTGKTSLGDLEKLETDYIWHYHDQERIRNIADTKFLKKIVIRHNDLEYLNSRGELYGFFHLFSDYFNKVIIEIQVDWNTEIIYSMFEHFKLPVISVEITNLIETSYQNPNCELINTFINTIKTNINNLKG
ncbi:MAG: hypothetical protein ACJAS4_000079 [Bacteriovoracaceae bacterium]|jgi:hypothetical protein